MMRSWSQERSRTRGRDRQKARTRSALLKAAARLIELGERPRIAAVAEEADVSRATAYRYFPSEDALLLEAGLARAFRPEGVFGDEDDPTERVAAAHGYTYDFATEHEAQFRLFLRATLDPERVDADDDPVRGGRRVALQEEALAPIRDRLSPEAYERLRLVLPVLAGIEPLVVIRDVCRAPSEHGRDALGWAARVLVEAALREGRD